MSEKPGFIKAELIVRKRYTGVVGEVEVRGEERNVRTTTGTDAILGVNPETESSGWYNRSDFDLGGHKPPVVDEGAAITAYEGYSLEGDSRRQAIYGEAGTRRDIDQETIDKGGDPSRQIPKNILPNENKKAKIPKVFRFRK